ncbi:MAG: HEAT repeat domain-containing protein [Bacteroidales bacterium]
MKRKIFNTTLLLIAIVLEVNAFAKSETIPAKGKFDSKFLIVIDKESFTAAKEEVLEYKSVLESEGLGAMILVGEWNNPETLRDEIRVIYNNKKPVLEGAVFVGKIPVVRVQNFQHATTAFKMDEIKYPIEESSVSSDRFYDDMDLEFELIKQDEKNPLHFYYRLKESSPQVIMSDFYSARMMPPTDMGVDPTVLLKRYLKKVVAAHKESNPLDQFVIFNGHGYNSDCLTAWQNEQFAIREQLPLAFKNSKGNGFYNFRQDPFMKYKLYEKLQQSGTDLFVFHEHGDFDTQYINGDYPAPNYLEVTSPNYDYASAGEKIGPMSVMAASLRNTYRRYKGERAASFRQELIEKYGFTEEFFDKLKLDSLRVRDSISAADMNIVLSDLTKIKMQPRFSIFDACYNGSFHKPDYIAGYHVFGDGNTIVAQGNTVNVLQDKWSLELIGMLSEGARVGFWQKEFQYLESHLIGDPTYRFYSEGSNTLNRNLATAYSKLWERYLNSPNPNLQALALTQLSKNPPKDFSARLLKIFKESKYYSVRMEALKRLLDIGDANMVEAIRLGLDDPYELIRRFSARFAGYSGDPVLVAPLVNTVLFSNESQRVQYAAQGSLLMFDINTVIKEIENQVGVSNLTGKQEVIQNLSGYYQSQQKSQEKSLKIILDKSAKPNDRLSAIRNIRNNNNHKQVENLLVMLKDNGEDQNLRVSLAEALGWFNLSICRSSIINALNAVCTDPASSPELKAESQQSLNRL